MRKPLFLLVSLFAFLPLAHAGNVVVSCKVDAMNPGHRDLQPASLVITREATGLTAELTVDGQSATYAVEQADLNDPVARIYADSLRDGGNAAGLEGYGLLTKQTSGSITKYDAVLLTSLDASGRSQGMTLFVGFGSGACK